ncbi:hypothetical protein [Corallococcus aberystwythensis]|uniref:Uncharacterized protein n=1 Tax=Corallococcus aberystwythensis TaxID=2316722 RepID=A0A3A8R187_9BACT|nr:hypothetical protein [Corallococcus aberystwythensis]RKH72960.1 hypothetical protein D7W81_05060 [Corallococcus aberystwythensis]
MNWSSPDIDTLRAYVHGELSGEEREAVRRWLVVHADEEVLRVYEGLLAERQRQEALLASWASQPMRARVEWSWSKLRHEFSTHGMRISQSLSERPAAFAPLGGRTSASEPELSLSVDPSKTVDVVVRLGQASHIAVYVVDFQGTLQAMPLEARRFEAGEELNLSGLDFGPGELEVNLFVLFDGEKPLPTPPAEAGLEWLAERLQEVATDAHRLAMRRTLRVPFPRPGKQS